MNGHGNGLAYEGVEVACFSLHKPTKALLHQFLSSLGFRRTIDCPSVHDIIRALDNQALDCLILDLDDATEEICQIIREIRHGFLGADAYVVTIALTSDLEQDTFKRAKEAGADDLITKPFTAEMLAGRTAELVHNRKNFVVTTNYVGPDRRAPGREHPADLPTIKAPNALRHKAAGDPEAAADTQALAAARYMVRKHLILRIAEQISREAPMPTAHPEGANGDSVSTSHLNVVAENVGALARLINEAKLVDLRPLAESMVMVAEMIGISDKANGRLLAVLRLHSKAITASIKEHVDATELVSAALDGAAAALVGPSEKQRGLFD